MQMCPKGYNSLTIEQIEEAAKQVFSATKYPRKIGDGLWEVAPGFIGGERLLQMFDEAIRKQLHETD